MSETMQSPRPARKHKPDSEGFYFSDAAIAESDRIQSIDALHAKALDGYRGEGFDPTPEQQAEIDARPQGFGVPGEPSGFENFEVKTISPTEHRIRKMAARVTGRFIKY